MKKKGFVYLVGAGPGRADLITVRGEEVLKSADCIIYDKLVNPALLSYARPDAEVIRTPKRVGPNSVTQKEINNLLIEKASAGQTIVRLKGGDPCVFARAAEEATALADAGIDFEIVPGVTAGIAAGTYAGIMLTDRTCSSQVVFVTGQEAEQRQKSNIDWSLLAKFNGTIVFYMAVGNLEFIVSELIKNGMTAETPSAVISDVSLPSQRTVKASLGKISEKCKQEGIEPPAIVIIGAAVKTNSSLSWFMNKPLFGKTIIITRDEKGNADFADKIINEGGNPVKFTTIRIKPLTHTNKFLQALAKLPEYDWIIFTSANAVTILFDCLQGLGKDARVFAASKIAAIGSETAAKLDKFGLKADFAPTVFTSRELAKQLIGYTNLQAKNILLLRSELASSELVELLEQAGTEVESVAVYTAVTERSESAWLIEKIKNGGIDWLTFASSSSVRGFFEQVPSEVASSNDVKVASIGPVTSEQLGNLGIRVDVEAREHTIDALLAALKGTYE